MNDAIATAMLEELRRIRIAVEAQHPVSDHAVLSRLLPAIAGRLGSENFTTRELLRDAVFQELAGMNGHNLGSLLSGAAAMSLNINGYAVEKIGTAHSAALWRVVRLVRLPDPL